MSEPKRFTFAEIAQAAMRSVELTLPDERWETEREMYRQRIAELLGMFAEVMGEFGGIGLEEPETNVENEPYSLNIFLSRLERAGVQRDTENEGVMRYFGI